MKVQKNYRFDPATVKMLDQLVTVYQNEYNKTYPQMPKKVYAGDVLALLIKKEINNYKISDLTGRPSVSLFQGRVK